VRDDGGADGRQRLIALREPAAVVKRHLELLPGSSLVLIEKHHLSDSQVRRGVMRIFPDDRLEHAARSRNLTGSKAIRYGRDSGRIWNLYSTVTSLGNLPEKAIGSARNAVAIAKSALAPADSVAQRLDLAVYQYSLASALLDGKDSHSRDEATALLRSVIEALKSPQFQPLRDDTDAHRQKCLCYSDEGAKLQRRPKQPPLHGVPSAPAHQCFGGTAGCAAGRAGAGALADVVVPGGAVGGAGATAPGSVTNVRSVCGRPSYWNSISGSGSSLA
jgi:hypothetical protein